MNLELIGIQINEKRRIAMNDKDKEINELKERLNKLENSQNSDDETPKDLEKEKIEKKAGFIVNTIVFFLIFAGLIWLFGDDSDSSVESEVSKTEEKKSTPSEDRNAIYRTQIITSLRNANFDAYWGQDSSLWIENSGYSKSELETFGYKLCDTTKNYYNESYIITFWQSLKNGPNGQILKVNCFQIDDWLKEKN